MLDKIKNFLYDVTVGFAKEYQARAINLAKIEAAAFYIKAVKTLRQHILALAAVLLSVTVLSVGIVVIPVTLVLCLSLSTQTKVLLLSLLGMFYICIPLAFINRFLSERAWMKMTKSDELLDKVLNS